MSMFYRYAFRTFGFLYFLFSSFSGLSQHMIEVKYEQDSKGAYLFSCFNNAYCNYILTVGFTTFTNVKSDIPLPFHGEVKPGFTKLFTISAIDPQAAIQIKFTSGYQKGCIQPVLNPGFIYLLPISPGKEAQVYEMSPDKSSDSAGWYVLRLRMKSGDTIYAARKGVVNEIHQTGVANDAGQSGIGEENYIEIVQPDCSFARYGVLKKNGALVSAGTPVRAGQPIGIVGGDAYGRGSDLRFSIYYYKEEASVSGARTLHYLIPLIVTKNNPPGKLKHGALYTAEFPQAVLNLETPKPPSKKRKPKMAFHAASHPNPISFVPSTKYSST